MARFHAALFLLLTAAIVAQAQTDSLWFTDPAAGDTVCAGQFVTFQYGMRHSGQAGQRVFLLRYDNGAWEYGGTLPVYPTNGDTTGLLPDQGVLIRMGAGRVQFGIRDSADLAFVAISDTIGITASCSPCAYAGPYAVDICGTPAGQYMLHALSARELLLLGTDCIRRSIDAGATWSVVATLPAQEPVAIRFNSARSIGYAVRARSIYQTTDNGATWTLQAAAPPTGVNARQAVVGDGRTVVLAVDSVGPTSTAMLFSNDGFATAGSGTLLPGKVQDMDLQPGGPQLFYACGLYRTGLGDTVAKVWRSDNGGSSWAEALASTLTREFTAMAFSANGAAAVVFGRPGDSIPGYFTVDRGGNWNQMQPLASYALPEDRIRDLRFFDDSTVFALGDNGRVIRSTDYGLSWSPCSDLRAADPGADWSATAFALHYEKANEHASYLLTRDRRLWRAVQLSNAPKLLSVRINGGDALTIVRGVQLSIQSTNAPAEYIASEDSAFAGASWQPFTANPAFTLSAGDGMKTVFVKLRNADGESGVASDDILYQNRFLTLDAPTGGESFPVGSQQEIRWSASRVANVTIRFSDDSGATWTLLADSIDASAGRWTWRVTGRPSAACRVRIADALQPSFSAESGDLTLLAAADDALLRAFAPVLYFHQENADRGWYPKECRVLTAQGELIEYRGDDPLQPSLVTGFGRSPDQLPSWNDGRYYLEYTLPLPANVSGAGYATTMYCRKGDAEDGRTVLQYWLFFPYHQADAAAITHEGDWQLIEVKLNAARTDFTDVDVRQHDWFRRYTKAQITTEGGSHAVFIMARGTQTPYAQTADPVAQGWQGRLSGAAGLLSGIRPAAGIAAAQLAAELTVRVGSAVTEAQAQLFLGWLFARARQSGGDAALAALACFEGAQQPTPALTALYTQFAGLAAAHPVEALSMDQKLTQADAVMFPLADSVAPWSRWKGHWGKRGPEPWSSGPLGPAGDRAWDKPFTLQRVPVASIDAAPLDNSLKALLPSLWLQTERQLTLRLAAPALLTVRSDSGASSGFPLPGVRMLNIPRSYAVRGYETASGDTAQLVGIYQPTGRYVLTARLAAPGALKLSDAWLLGDSAVLGFERQLALPAGDYFQEVLTAGASAVFGPLLGVPPVPAFPTNGMQDVPVQTTFLWHGSDGADSYEIDISRDSLFATSDVHQTGITDTTRAVVGLEHLARYYWRVRASHAYGTSPWSAVHAFTTLVATPITPTLLSPADKSRDVPRTVALIWGASTDAVSYHVQLSARADFLTTIVDTQNVAGTQFPLGGLLPNATYYWRVRARNAAGTSAWATPFSFTTVPLTPDPPTLTAPADNATGVPVTATLQWTAPPGATSYQLQVSTSASFATLLRDTANLIATSFTLSGLANSTTHHWRVRAANAGGTSAWSTAFRFTTIGTLPAVPVLASPANGATGVSRTPALAWSPASGALTYRVQVSASSTFATTVFDSASIATTFATARNLAASTQYYWRVCATNTVGSSAWSAAWYFTTAGAAPAAPVLQSPSNNATGVALQPTLAWTGTPSVISYRVQLSTSAAFSTLVMDTANVAATSIVTRVLTASTKYYWRANASNASGTSAWSAVWNFTTGTAVLPPDKVVLLLPANNATNVAVPVACSWSAAARATRYRIMIDTSASFTKPFIDSSTVTGTSFAAAGLASGQRYFWRVAGINASGAGTWSDTWNFRTLSTAPAAPRLLAPADRAVLAASAQTLRWSRIAGCTYRVQAATDSGFLRLVRDAPGVADTTLLLADLRNDTTYHWRVNATNASGTSPWATAFRFTVRDDEPPAVALLSPACDSVAERKGLLLSVLLGDAGSGIDSARISVRIDGALLLDSAQARAYYDAATGRLELPLDTLSFGVHEIAIRAVDRLGNATDLACTVTVGTDYGIVLGSGGVTRNVRIYPNPGDGSFSVAVRDASLASPTVAVYSVLGQELRRAAASWVRDERAGLWRLAAPLDLRDLPPGRYLLVLGDVAVHTLIKL